MIAVLSQHDEEVEKELVTVTVDHLLVVVQAKEDDVEHQGHVHRPVNAVTVQVWSLTQFYSVDFSQSRISVNKCVFNKRTIKVCVSCC